MSGERERYSSHPKKITEGEIYPWTPSWIFPKLNNLAFGTFENCILSVAARSPFSSSLGDTAKTHISGRHGKTTPTLFCERHGGLGTT